MRSSSDRAPRSARTVSLRALAVAATLCLLPALATAQAPAQDPGIKVQTFGGERAFTNQAGGMFGRAPKVNSALPLNLQADQLIYDTKGGKIVARGNVEVFYNNFRLSADEIVYDQRANLLIASGNAQLRDPNGNITRADRLEATDDFRDAFVQSLSVVTKDETRIAARRATRRDGNVTEYEQAKFTPCRNEPGQSPLWCISAARIVHDQKAATITYQNAAFELFGTPVFYLPYFQHADPSVKRKSGFLAPHVGTSSTLGFRFEVPYYFALAPNYDFTFNPEYLSKQGLLYKGEFRHRLANGQYSVRFGALDQNVKNLPDAEASASLDGWRGTLETRGHFSLSSWWSAGWDVTVESDKSFRRFYGFDGAFQTDRVNVGYLVGMSDRNYFGAKLYHFGGLLTNEDSTVATSRVHPVVDYNYVAGQPVLGGELSANVHVRSMSRTNGLSFDADPNKVRTGADSTHAVTEIAWRRKLIDPIGQTWTPFANVRGDVYSFSDTRDPVTGLPLEKDSLARGVGTVGLTYAYPFVAHTQTASHVVEPTVQVVSRHMNHVDQRLLPNEDSKSVNLDEGLLFDIRKTSGFDRIDTGTRLNAGLQYTFQANNGFAARAAFGQSFHLSGTNVFSDPGRDVTSANPTGSFPNAFNPFTGLETARSDYVAGIYVSPVKNLSLAAQARFDESDWSLRRQDTLLSFAMGPLTTQAIYSFKSADPQLAVTDPNFDRNQKELQLNLGLKLTENWSLLGGTRYDIDQRFFIQNGVGLRYADECFVLTSTFTETNTTDAALGIKPDRTVMLRFELKHLGEFNYRTDVTSFLNRGENQ
jgi:LPS-assembly protein